MSTELILVQFKGRCKDHYPKEKKANLLTASGQIYSLFYGTFFLPIMCGDFIYAKCNFKNNDPKSKELILTSNPLVQLGVDEPCIKMEIKNGAGKYFSDQRIEQLYDKFVDEAKGKANVSSYIDKMAESYNNTKSKGLTMALSPICNELQAQALLTYWYKKRVLRGLYLMGLNNSEINNLKEQFSIEEIYKNCIENPYLLTDIKIEKCDDILARQNKVIGETDKMVAILAREIDRICKQRSHTGIQSWLVLKMWPLFPQFMEKLVQQYGVVGDLETIYPAINYTAEISVCNRIVELLKAEKYDFGEVKFYDEKTTDDQKDAVRNALNSWVYMIQGDAGTGKSTTIKEIVKNLEEKEEKFKCGAFTGKSCSRLREILGKNHPSTLDRLISQNTEHFDWLIIDEFTQTGLSLLYRFLKKFTHKFHIIFVFDLKQLQSINYGNPAFQLVTSNIVPSSTLIYNHRIQSGGKLNKILVNALGMFNTDDGEYFDFKAGTEFQLYNNDTMIPITEILKMLKNSNVEAKDIQIITYYNKHLALLNKTFQDVYKSSDEFCIDSSGRVLFKNDRVVNNKNDYETNIMNGDCGIITFVSPDKIKVFYEAYNHTETYSTSINKDDMDYKEADVGRLDVAFATSIDKFQGSQAKFIILYCPTDAINKSFLDMNRLYTTFTRAMVAFFAVGNILQLLEGARKSPRYRHDKLAFRLRIAMGLPGIQEPIMDEDYEYN